MHKPSLVIGTIFSLLGIVLGAFGAHYLKTILTPELVQSFETGVRYQMYHGLALLLFGMMAKHLKTSIRTVFLFLTFGTILFSGSIYLLSILKSTTTIGLSGIGILTPIGGMLMITGWTIFLVNLLKEKIN